MQLRTARVFVSDLKAAHRFYADILELPLVAGGPGDGWCVFDVGAGMQLVIESVAPDAPSDDRALVARFTGLSFTVAANAVQCVAMDAAVVVGWADIFPAWAHAVRHIGSLGMGLLPAYRGRGIGQSLLQACIEKAWAQGLTRIDLEARADNQRAIRLYERCGFVHDAIKPRGMCFDGTYYDAVQMGLLKPLA